MSDKKSNKRRFTIDRSNAPISNHFRRTVDTPQDNSNMMSNYNSNELPSYNSNGLPNPLFESSSSQDVIPMMTPLTNDISNKGQITCHQGSVNFSSVINNNNNVFNNAQPSQQSTEIDECFNISRRGTADSSITCDTYIRGYEEFYIFNQDLVNEFQKLVSNMQIPHGGTIFTPDNHKRAPLWKVGLLYTIKEKGEDVLKWVCPFPDCPPKSRTVTMTLLQDKTYQTSNVTAHLKSHHLITEATRKNLERQESENDLKEANTVTQNMMNNDVRFHRVSHAIWIAAYNIPLWIVTKQKFRMAHREQAGMLDFPVKQLKIHIIEVYCTMVGKLKSTFKRIRESLGGKPFISLNYDLWTAKVVRAKYIGVCVFYVDENFNRCTECLGFKQFDPDYDLLEESGNVAMSELLLRFLLYTLDTFGLSLNDVFSSTTDKGSDVHLAMSKLLPNAVAQFNAIPDDLDLANDGDNVAYDNLANMTAHDANDNLSHVHTDASNNHTNNTSSDNDKSKTFHKPKVFWDHCIPHLLNLALREAFGSNIKPVDTLLHPFDEHNNECRELLIMVKKDIDYVRLSPRNTAELWQSQFDDDIIFPVQLHNAIPQRWYSMAKALKHFLILFPKMAWVCQGTEFTYDEKTKEQLLQLYSLLQPVNKIIQMAQGNKTPVTANVFSHLFVLMRQTLKPDTKLQKINPENEDSEEIEYFNNLTDLTKKTRLMLRKAIMKRLWRRYSQKPKGAENDRSYMFDLSMALCPVYAQMHHVEKILEDYENDYQQGFTNNEKKSRRIMSCPPLYDADDIKSNTWDIIKYLAIEQYMAKHKNDTNETSITFDKKDAGNISAAGKEAFSELLNVRKSTSTNPTNDSLYKKKAKEALYEKAKNKVELEIGTYLEIIESCQDMDFVFNPLLFWKKFQNIFPYLASVARIIFGGTCSSAAVELSFCLSGLILSRKRNSLAAAMVDILGFIYVNKMLIPDIIHVITMTETEANVQLKEKYRGAALTFELMGGVEKPDELESKHLLPDDFDEDHLLDVETIQDVQTF